MSKKMPPPNVAGSGFDSPLGYAIAERDRDVIAMVKEAVRRRDVLLAFQPVVQTERMHRPAFYEGLIRVRDTTGRIIPAREFIDAIETQETGRIIDCLALEFGLRALAEEPDLRLSINMSARSIGYQRWIEVLNRGLAEEPTIAERLILEITESSAMVMPDIVQVFMTGLQDRGISFALDDFGAGYTAFRYLKDFYFDILKIDAQFIRNIHRDPDAQVLTKALVSIGRHFDMFTVAEGVETLEDANYAASIGIDCLQGYYFGPPTVDPIWQLQQRVRSAG